MKNKSFHRRLSFFATQRIHGNVLAWVNPDSETQKGKTGVKHILRWEDDGGQIGDPGNVMITLNPDTAREQANKS